MLVMNTGICISSPCVTKRGNVTWMTSGILDGDLLGAADLRRARGDRHDAELAAIRRHVERNRQPCRRCRPAVRRRTARPAAAAASTDRRRHPFLVAIMIIAAAGLR